MRWIVSFVGFVLEVDRFSLTGGSLRSIRVCLRFDISKSLIFRAWIRYRNDYVWVEF